MGSASERSGWAEQTGGLDGLHGAGCGAVGHGSKSHECSKCQRGF